MVTEVNYTLNTMIQSDLRLSISCYALQTVKIKFRCFKKAAQNSGVMHVSHGCTKTPGEGKANPFLHMASGSVNSTSGCMYKEVKVSDTNPHPREQSDNKKTSNSHCAPHI